MTDKNREIEEMAKILCGMKNGCDGCMWDKVHCNERNYAEEIYNAGYRKATDVAAEIFEEIEEVMRSLDRRYMASGNPKQSWGVRGAMTEIAELKNKYTGEGK